MTTPRNDRGMPCAACGSDSKVIDSRPSGGRIRRRRECLQCRARWTTWEINAADDAVPTDTIHRHAQEALAAIEKLAAIVAPK